MNRILILIAFAFISISVNAQNPAIKAMTFNNQAPIEEGEVTELLVAGANQSFNTIEGSRPGYGFKVKVTLNGSNPTPYRYTPSSTAAVQILTDPAKWNVTFTTEGFADVMFFDLIGDLGPAEEFIFKFQVIGVSETAGVAKISLADIDFNSDPGTILTNKIDDDDKTAGLTVVAKTTPVTYSKFDAKAVGTDAVLNWATASEVNNSHFDVERSLDGKTFTKVGEVEGNGTSTSTIKYAYTDAGVGLPNFEAQYRLKQVDFDGLYEYSNVKTVRFGKGTSVRVYPNLVNDNVTVEYAGQAKVLIYDAYGKLVAKENLGVINCSSYAAGTYLVKVADADNTVIASEKIVVVK